MTGLFEGEHTPQSRGGKARAETLSPERRKEIAKAAAERRWGTQDDNLPKVLCGSPDRPLRIGDIEIPCYVLVDEARVLSQRGVVSSLGMKYGSRAGGADRLTAFLSGKSISDNVSRDLMVLIANPIKFHGSGGITFGYPATILVDICDAVLAARKAGTLQKQQEHIADRAELLLRGFARVGIIALVDEATGYQYIRARTALEQILDKWLVKELQPWKRYFPIEYYKRIHELHDWPFNPESTKHPSIVGKYTNDIIYDRLGPGLREELHDYAGRDEKGRLKHVLTRFLTTDHGIPQLKSHFDGVVALMRASGNWKQFIEMLDRAYPKPATTLKMAFDDLDQIGR
jgi:hypothetical protein